ncbi:MAG: c-type cytochrome, partial [Pseudomonadota bacterium]
YAVSSIKEGVVSRITPIGDLCMVGDPCAAAPVAVVSGPRSGDQVYNGACIACHSAGAAGAPVFGDVAAWSALVGKGIDTLYANAINGIGGMPAKGLCMDCSDDEIKVAVDYMIENSE